MRTAAIEYVDQAKVLEEAREIALRIQQRHPEVGRAILFGSFALGKGRPRSDLDLVLIIESSDLPPRERGPHYRPFTQRPIDLFVYTRAEAEGAPERPPVLREALRHGIELLEPCTTPDVSAAAGVRAVTAHEGAEVLDQFPSKSSPEGPSMR